MAHGLSSIDWEAPWLKPWRERGEPIAQQVKEGASVEQACNASLAFLKRQLCIQDSGTQSICEVEFVPQSALPDGQAYEQFIFDTHSVPTRDGLHDFFNALCWLQFPLAKKQINLVQARAIQAQGVGSVRGPVRDAVTVFDENATLIQLPDSLWHALQERNWQTAFGAMKAHWADLGLWPCGLGKIGQSLQSHHGSLVASAIQSAPIRVGCLVGPRPAAQQVGPQTFLAHPCVGHPGVVASQ